jgi:Diacylglycerol acyltransferase
MAAPGLGHYMRSAGVVPARREAIEAALGAGHDVVVWPGGEVDAMRSWKKRDQVVLGGRKGFIRLAIRQRGSARFRASGKPTAARSGLRRHAARRGRCGSVTSIPARSSTDA